MSAEFQTRESSAEDSIAIESIYPRAFPDEDLVPLVQDLLQSPDVALSLVAVAGGEIAGHVIFTTCGVVGGNVNVALLGPLAVDPPWQKQGIGSALVQAGLQQLQGSGVSVVCVLGDPKYYGRFGFAAETLIEPPYPLPPEWEGAWQSASLDGVGTGITGVLSVPPVWRRPALWAP